MLSKDDIEYIIELVKQVGCKTLIWQKGFIYALRLVIDEEKKGD